MMKLVYFFNQGSRGWTETYYSADTDPNVAVSFPGQTTFSAMLNFRANGTSLAGIRASDLSGLRPSAFRNLATVQSGFTTTVSNSSSPDVVTTTGVVRFFGTSGRTRALFLRGLRDEDVLRSNTGQDAPSSFLIASIKTLGIRLSTNQYGILLTTQPPAGGLSWINVVGARISSLGVGFTDLILGSVPGFINVGNIARFRRIPRNDLPGFPRRATVIATDFAGTSPFITIPYRYREPATIATPGMVVTTYAFSLDPFNGQAFERFSEHKTGRPTVSLRGRSRSLVRAR